MQNFTNKDLDLLLEAFRRIVSFHLELGDFLGSNVCFDTIASFEDDILSTLKKLFDVKLGFKIDDLDDGMFGWVTTDLLMETKKDKKLSSTKIINLIKKKIKENKEEGEI